jgi:hypothetical protein
MDWSNESYVRLYTRDTTNWKRMGWPARSVLPLLLRKVDRSGALDLDGLEPWEAVMLHVECPEEVAREGVAKLLQLGTVELRGGLLVFPNHIPAQTATKSDRLRAKESRARRASGRPECDVTEESQNVTTSSRSVTDASRTHESGHEPSHEVTPRHSMLCSAVQCSALPSGERERDEPAQDSLPPGRGAEPPEREDGEPEPSDADRLRLRELVALRYSVRFNELRGNPPARTPKQSTGYESIARWLDDKGGDPERVLRTLLDGWFADAWARDHGYPISALANDPPKYYAPPKVLRGSRRSGFMPPAQPEDFEPATDLDTIFGRKAAGAEGAE